MRYVLLQSFIFPLELAIAVNLFKCSELTWIKNLNFLALNLIAIIETILIARPALYSGKE